MDNAAYVSLTRQAGLFGEMRAIANNLANLSTTGFRKEGVVFAEHVTDLEGQEASLSMATARGRVVDLTQGSFTQTGGTFDLAIDGEGFFQIELPDGPQLTRAGAFTLSPEGELVTLDGYRVLDAGGAPILVPPGAPPAIAADGTISVAGEPVGQIGVVTTENPSELVHESGTRFHPSGDVLPVDTPHIFQGFLETSNVNPVLEITRMIEVQRAYEAGQSFLDKEDARIRAVIETLGR